jgi:hypothetical protein
MPRNHDGCDSGATGGGDGGAAAAAGILIPVGDGGGDASDCEEDSAFFGLASQDGHSGSNHSSQGLIAETTQQTRTVFRYKAVVVMVLITSAILVAAWTYFYTSRSEQEKFTTQFHADSTKVWEAFGSNLDKMLGLLDSVAVTLVSTVRNDDETSWPFVTIPNFAVRMSKLLPFMAALNINVLPLVTVEERFRWEAYTLFNNDWVNENMAFQEHWEGFHGPVVYNGTTNPVIHGDFGNLPYKSS